MRQTIHMIGNAHIDAVWLWRWQEGFAEIKATFRSALDRMKEFDEFHFSSGCAIYYEWIEKSDPAMFEEIRARVREGRWHIVGGWMLQPDCNLPSGESFARQGLMGQRYFKEKFGITATSGYNVDSFGHNGNLPQILKKSGMDSYVFMRPQRHEKELAQSCFLWESMDGSTVTAYRIPVTYAITTQNYQVFDEIAALAQQESSDLMAFFGVGNHGGGPTIQLLEQICRDKREGFVFSHCDSYFAGIDQATLPTLHDDLQYHAKGCYSAFSKIKRDNRVCEHNLLTAEKYSVLANCLCGEDYPAPSLKKAWKNVLFNQFHDLLGGCAIKDAYTDAAYLHGETMSITEQLINFAMQQISWSIDTTGNAPISGERDDWKLWTNEAVGTPVVVFNPHPWDICVPVRLNAVLKKICSDDGRECPIQKIRGKQTSGVSDKYNTLFLARVPALGYQTYRMYIKTEGSEFLPQYSNTDHIIENDFLRAEFDETTNSLVRLFDKKGNRELLSGECGAVLMDDRQNDTWAHGKERFKHQIGAFVAERVQLLENGPVRSVIRQVMTYGTSVLQQDYILYADKDELEIHVTADFREKHKILKMTVPASVDAPRALCEIPYGFIERPTNGDESVGGQWICLTDEDHHGLGITNDSKYSFDVENCTVSLTAIRTAIFADHYGTRDDFCEFMDMGVQEFTYSIHPFRSLSDTVRRAMELNVPERHVIETFHKGKLPTHFSGVKISAENVILTAVKQAEDKNGIIVRCFETENRDTQATIELPLLNVSFCADFGHNEIKTICIANDGTVSEVNLLEE